MALTPPHREWFQSNVPSYQLGKRVLGFRQSITDMCRGRHNHFTDCHQSRAVTQGSDPSVYFHWQPPRKMADACKLTGAWIGYLWRLKNSCVPNISKPLNAFAWRLHAFLENIYGITRGEGDGKLVEIALEKQKYFGSDLLKLSLN